MIVKTPHLSRVIIALALFITSYSAVAGQSEAATRVVAIVVDIENRRPPPYHDFVTVLLTINSPAELTGSQFILVTKSQERRAVRSQFPLASLRSLALPQSVVAALIEQRSGRENIERRVDSGIERKVISDLIMIPELNIADLPAPPTAGSVTP